MEWIMVIFGLICTISFIWNLESNDKDNRVFSACILTISAILFVALFSSYENRNTPTAMDVYQGKTSLEITYRDSIPVDSIVVFKDEFKKAMEE